MRLLCVKSNGVIKPASPEAEEVFSRIHNGATIMVEISQVRNPRFTRLYWASIDMIVDNHNPLGFTYKYDLHEYVKERLGVESIQEDKMDEVGFAEFFERYKDLRASELMPEVSDDVFWNEAEQRL